MKRNRFSILFWIHKTKLNHDKEAPIYCRITVNGDRTGFAVSRTILPDEWDNKANRAKGRTQNKAILNEYLDEVEMKVREHHKKIIGYIISQIHKTTICLFVKI